MESRNIQTMMVRNTMSSENWKEETKASGGGNKKISRKFSAWKEW